jgi:hypothetical protein
MNTVRWIISTASEIFLLLAVAIGTIFGRVRIRVTYVFGYILTLLNRS